jgi:hypothetical protein
MDWNTSTITKRKRIYSSVTMSVTTYGAKSWKINKESHWKLLVTDMGLWRTCVRNVLEDKVRNEVSAEEVEVEKTMKDRITEERLIWHGHARRMEEHWLRRKVLEWSLPGRRGGGRPRQIWNEDVAKLAMERSQSEEDAENRERQRLRARKF